MENCTGLSRYLTRNSETCSEVIEDGLCRTCIMSLVKRDKWLELRHECSEIYSRGLCQTCYATARNWGVLEQIASNPAKRGRKAMTLETFLEAREDHSCRGRRIIARELCQWCYVNAGKFGLLDTLERK